MNQFTGNVYDVAVVGSGPAGSSAALPLARQGLKVAVIEKASLPRYKACGGGVARRAIQLLPMDVGEVIECECHIVNVNLLGDNLNFSVKKREPIISMTMRERFDFLLVSAAKDAGAHIRSKCEVLGLARQEDRVELITNQGPLQARFIVAADGARSIVAQDAGWEKHQNIAPTLEYEIFLPEGELKKFWGVARFDLGLVPHGYAWVFPKRDHLSVGIGSGEPGPLDLKKTMEQYLATIALDKVERMECHGFFIPLSPREGGFMRERVLLAGDAAGFADPFSGEGITFAIQSGQIAARALLEGGLDAGRVKEVYCSEIKKSILPELRLGRVLAKLVHKHPKMGTWLIRFYGQMFFEQLSDVIVGKISYSGMLRNLLRCFKPFGFVSVDKTARGDIFK